MLATYTFSETSPSSATTAASSQPVQNSASWAAAGVAGGMLENADSIDVIAILKGASNGVLDVYMQVSADAGNTWVDAIHWPQLAAGAGTTVYKATLSQLTQPASAAPVVVGTGTSPALAANTVVQGVGFDRARLLFVAGSGTSAGAAIKVILVATKSFDYHG